MKFCHYSSHVHIPSHYSSLDAKCVKFCHYISLSSLHNLQSYFLMLALVEFINLCNHNLYLYYAQKSYYICSCFMYISSFLLKCAPSKIQEITLRSYIWLSNCLSSPPPLKMSSSIYKTLVSKVSLFLSLQGAKSWFLHMPI